MSCDPRKQKALEAQGWQRRSWLEEPRLSEAVREYRELGFAVHLEPVDPQVCQESQGCAACLQDPQVAARCQVIFTRREPGRGKG